MSFQPITPASGNLGWIFLTASRERQQVAFNASPPIKTNTDYFLENVASIQSAEDLVKDRRLLAVALGAFGLDDDINNTFFVKKVLEEGTLADDAFANRLSDRRYFAMADAFGFHLDPPNTALSNFGDQVVEHFQTRQFEVAIGAQDETLRLSLSAARDLEDLASRSLGEDTAWFTVMGNPPLRKVFETALGLPPQLAAIDLDQQLEEFRGRALDLFAASDPSAFSEPELREKLIQNYLFRAELEASRSATSSGSIALSLLQSFASPA
ncbi:MAG: DUF1217 domain-containing protein [Paracoccaceae bacterium]